MRFGWTATCALPPNRKKNMAEPRSKNGNGNGFRALRRWHRRIGIAAALFALLLSTTGIALNHAAFLDLYETKLRAGWLLDWYGMRGVEGPIAAAEAGGLWIAMADGHIFAAGKIAGEVDDAPLVGAAASKGIVAAGGGDRLFLFTSAGELVETLDETALPGPIARIGTAHGAVAVETEDGALYVADASLSTWRPSTGPVDWTRTAPLPAAEAGALEAAIRGEGLPLYRLILDIHAGRFFTAAGPLAMDLAALALIALSVTGLWVWLKQRR